MGVAPGPFTRLCLGAPAPSVESPRERIAFADGEADSEFSPEYRIGGDFNGEPEETLDHGGK